MKWELKKIKLSTKEVVSHETKKRTNMTYILGKICEKGGFVDKLGKPSIKGLIIATTKAYYKDSHGNERKFDMSILDIWKPRLLASLPATFLILPPATHLFPIRPGEGTPLHIERFIEEKSKVFRDSLTNEVMEETRPSYKVSKVDKVVEGDHGSGLPPSHPIPATLSTGKDLGNPNQVISTEADTADTERGKDDDMRQSEEKHSDNDQGSSVKSKDEAAFETRIQWFGQQVEQSLEMLRNELAEKFPGQEIDPQIESLCAEFVKKIQTTMKDLDAEVEVILDPTDSTDGQRSGSSTESDSGPEEAFSQGLPCIFHPAPAQVSQGILTQFRKYLNEALAHEGLILEDSKSGPVVAFAVNSSRLLSDIARDLKGVGSTTSTVLVVLKPTKDHGKKLESLVASNLGFPWVKEAAYLLVDTRNTLIHQCNTNTDTLSTVISFLKKQNITIKQEKTYGSSTFY